MEKRPPLSPRLLQIAQLVPPCSCMADIGTDHGYLPVWLCQKEIVRTAIASDINQGPLDRAEETVRRYGMTDRISLRLGGGAETLSPGEADTLVIAGMGGLLIGEILDAHPEVFERASRILLQPMSSIPELRQRLYQMGYSILEELLVPEEEKLYHILSVKKKPEEEPLSSVDFLLGRRLCHDKPPYFDRYLSLQKERYSRKLAGLKQGKTTDQTALYETEAILQRLETL